ncbi:MAG: PKD domain-containing protein, partial [Thermoplasmata archaeon]|nr:PKD domain-containing protein [Thermoplasmata archaeon]
DTFNYIPAPYFAVDSAKGFTVKCSRLPSSPPLPGPCSATPQFGPLGSLNQGVGWAWPDNTMYLGDSWSVSFDVIAQPNYPNTLLKLQVPLDSCLPPGPGGGPWSNACKPIPGSGPASYTSMEYVTYAGSQLSPAQSFPPAFVTVLGVDPVNVTLSVSETVGEVPFDPQFQAVASAGTAPFQFHFEFGDGGKLSLSSNNLSVGPVGYTYSTPGSYNVSLVTWDAVGHNFSIPVLQIHAVSALNASLAAFQNGAVVPPGTTLLGSGALSFSVLHDGGWGPYAVDWFVNGTWMANTLGLWNYTAAPGENCTIRAVLSDALGETTTMVRSFSILPVPSGGPPPPPLTVALFANRTELPAGENVTLVGSASGGRAPFTWTWSLGSVMTSTTLPMISATLSTPGNVTAELIVEDTDNKTAVSNTLTIWVTALGGQSTGGGKLQSPSDPSGGHVPPSPPAPTLPFSPWAPWLSLLLVLTSAYVSIMLGGLWLDRVPPRPRSSVRGNRLEERSRMDRRGPHVPLARRPSWHP